MFDVSAANLTREKDNAVEHMKRLLDKLQERIRRYHGPHFKGVTVDGQEEDYDPENLAYQYMALMLPRTVPAPLRVKLSTRRPSAQRQAVEAIEFALNRWAIDSDYQELREEVATDYYLSWGVTMATLERQPGYEEHDDPLMWPRLRRISPYDFIFDPLAASVKEARFLGHRILADKESLLDLAKNEEGWNEEIIQGLGENVGLEDTARRGDMGKTSVDRHEIAYWEIWVPEYELEESEGAAAGYHGTIFTIAEGSDSSDQGGDGRGSISPKEAYLREPRPYFGPRWGPYSMHGAYYVPDEVAPLSPLTAVQEQSSDLNKLVRAAFHNDTQYKRVVLVDSRNPALAQKLKDTPDSFVIPVRGFEKDKVEVIELGGSSPQQHVAIERQRYIVDRGLGMDDALRGSVSGQGTATEHSIASEAGETRIGFVVGRFTRAEEQALRTVAWFMYHVDEVVLPLGKDAEEALGIPDPVFLGGTFEEGSGATFDDLGVEIDTTPAGAAQQRALVAIQTFMQFAAALVQLPFIKARKALHELGMALGTPELEELVDYEALAVVQQNQPQGDPADTEPRLGRDLGALGTVKRRIKAAPAGPREAAPVKQGAQPAQEAATVGAA